LSSSSNNKKKVLVTGSAGFIGMHTALRLAKEGYHVIGLDNLNTYYSVELKLARLKEQGISTENLEYNKLVKGKNGIQFIQLDLVDTAAMEELFEKYQFDRVVHLAAQAGVRYSIENPHAYIDSNVKGFLNILEFAKDQKVEHVIFASSSSVYGNSCEVPFREDAKTDSQVSLYAATKKANEAMAHSYASVHNQYITGLRLFTVYGPFGRPDMAIFKFTERILRDKPIDVYNNGDLRRDFTYIADIVEGIILVINTSVERQKRYEIYNLGNGEPVELMDFISKLELAISKKATLNMLPMQAGDVYETYASTKKLYLDVGYTAKVNIEEGVRKFVNWYLKWN
jgi:UDP-glucuronate 4-epimerase